MAGPGGGSRGGGFGGGSFGGGGGGRGFGGGGFRGGPHFHGPHYHGYYGGYRRHYYGGGCLGGLMSFLLAPIILFFLAVALIISSIGGAFSDIASGGSFNYEEPALQAYADAAYRDAFGNDEDTYEDNLLIVFLANEDADGYYCIAWVGDNIKSSIRNMFGDEHTKFGNAMLSNVDNDYYAYSLDTSLAVVMEVMAEEIKDLNLSSSFVSTPQENDYTSHLVNRTELSLTEATVNRALESFTETTGISAVIVVDDVDAVFDKSIDGSSIFTIILAVGLLAFAVFLIVRAVKKRNEENEDNGNGNRSGNDRYNGGTWS